MKNGRSIFKIVSERFNHEIQKDMRERGRERKREREKEGEGGRGEREVEGERERGEGEREVSESHTEGAYFWTTVVIEPHHLAEHCVCGLSRYMYSCSNLC